MTTTRPAPITMLIPDFPFSYDEWLRHPAGLGSIPADRLGARVAVVGGGIAGLTAAYELMRLGLRPIVYEAEQLGGRLRSVSFPGAPNAVAEMGAMRFPISARSLFHYVDLLGLPTRRFPNPLAPGTPATVVHLNGETHHARTADDLPEPYQEVADAWEKVLTEHAELFTMSTAIRERDVPTLKSVWNRLVTELDDTSFWGFLSATPAFRSFRHRELFGQVGFGSGGWDTDFPNSVLEILRVVYTGADADHMLIAGGCQQLPRGLWYHRPARLAHWQQGTSLALLHGEEGPRPAVATLRRRDGGIEVRDTDGRGEVFQAVVCTPHVWTMLNRIDCDPALLTQDQWTAIERTHYMGASKLFVRTDRPFWRDINPATGRETMGMTLTDRIARGVYLFDNGADQPGVMCLSYTWNDDSLKVATLSAAERLEVLLTRLADIYPGVDIRSHIVGDPIAVTWETEPAFMGAFRSNLPGQYRYQRRLFTQFMDEPDGFFLCGDDVSWTAGFAEGAITTALNAVWGVVHRLGGATPADNPGPGDLFDRLAPIELPYS